jgi:restriction endonuclease Mrr
LALGFGQIPRVLRVYAAAASAMDQLPTQANHLTRLHEAVIAKTAAGGFYVTTRGFSRDAEAYAKTAPIKLVDGPKLVASIKRSMEGTLSGMKFSICRRLNPSAF